MWGMAAPQPPPLLAPMTPAHWPEVVAIFREGIATGNATFESDAPPWERWDAAHLAAGRLVAAGGARVAGWVALGRVSDRCAYAGVAEVSLYVAAAARGRGVGGLLLDGVIEAAERAGLWTLQAGIFPENAASLALFDGRGFRRLGRRERIGRLGGKWRDVWLLERRSRVVGADA